MTLEHLHPDPVDLVPELASLVWLDHWVSGSVSVVRARHSRSCRSVPFLRATGYCPGPNDAPVIKAAPRLLRPCRADDLVRRTTEASIQAKGDAQKLSLQLWRKRCALAAFCRRLGCAA
jgi:hypothetical protein